jgi:Zn-finger nucleic acid-binding protein
MALSSKMTLKNQDRGKLEKMLEDMKQEKADETKSSEEQYEGLKHSKDVEQLASTGMQYEEPNRKKNKSLYRFLVPAGSFVGGICGLFMAIDCVNKFHPNINNYYTVVLISCAAGAAIGAGTSLVCCYYTLKEELRNKK